MSLISGYNSLAENVNKVGSPEGVTVSDLLPELTLEMEDEELISLKKNWEKRWNPYQEQIAKIQKDNENYWLGKQFTVDGGERPLVDKIGRAHV